MGEQIRYALTIFAVLAALLILVAYYTGTKAAGGAILGGLKDLALIFQGRTTTTQQFAGYPPGSGSGG